MHVLLIEPDDRVAKTLINTLSAHGHRLQRCQPDADTVAAHSGADLVVLNQTDTQGLELVRKLGRISDVPVLFVGRHRAPRALALAGAAPDRRTGLDELLTTVGEVSGTTRAVVRPLVRVGDLTINLRARTVHVAGRQIELTTKEFSILAVLARRIGTAISRQEIMTEVWEEASEGTSHALNVHLAALRAKLRRPALLRTIRGFGYRLG